MDLILWLLMLFTLSTAIHNSETDCKCVRFWQCKGGAELINGAGLISDRSTVIEKKLKRTQRMKECKSALDLCCEPENLKFREKVEALTVSNENIERGCGMRNSNGIGLKSAKQSEKKAKFGEFPWMVAILYRTSKKLDFYRCGGSLIHQKVVMTAAHCVHGLDAASIKIRAGEWNTQTTEEIIPHQDRAVEAIIVHENYNPKALRNDVALLILNNPVKIKESVDVVCLPEMNNDFDAFRCTATGWGRDKFGKEGQHPDILKTVDLYLVPQLACQGDLRKTRLGPKFLLDESFICANGVNREDTCKGDGGSPLICPLENDPKRFVQIGIVSWGIKCGDDVPGVYTNILHVRKWIDEQLMFHNLDNSVYRYLLYTEDQ